VRVPGEIPLDSVENAQEYIRLLIEAVREAKVIRALDSSTGFIGGCVGT
jgi:hypothetical protein